MQNIFDTFLQQNTNTPLFSSLTKSLTLWKEFTPINIEAAYQLFEDKEIYGLKMLWQGRLDKISIEKKELYIWLSQNYLPNYINFDSKNIKDVQFINENHDTLAKDILTNVWNDYIHSSFSIEKPNFKKTLFSKIKSFF